MPNSDLLIAQLQRRNRIMFGGMLAGLAVIAIGLGLVMLDATTEVTPPPPTDTSSSAAPTKNAPTSPASGPTTSGLTTSGPLSAGSEQAVTSNAADPATAAESAEDKKRFLSAVQEFNSGIKAEAALFPELAASSDYLQMINQLEADLVSLTGQNRYKDAAATLASTATMLETMMGAELDKFDQLIGEADTAWQKKELANLARILAKAGAIYQGNQDPIIHFQALADDWPAISVALQRADTAGIENNPADEQKALQIITGLQHDIAGLDDRLADVGRRLHQQRVDDLLGRIAAALAADDANTARTALAKLRALDPNTPEISKLGADLAQLEEQIAFQTTMRAMDQFAANDNWAAAQKLANRHRKDFATYQTFQQRADFIEQIYQLITRVTKLLDSPDDFIKPSTKKLATRLIVDAKLALAYSPTLTKLSAALSEHLASYTTPLDIIVMSDNVTFVEVKSVGQVGTVVQKTIQLLPGDYVFVGKRKGYVTIQVPVALRPGDSGKEISVIAHEQI
ncbi:MAG: hypothetical protein O3C30_00690 [Proteobacteria bacterium]|nr:hypothetical protein [Pseudomonadota bacterium]